jgi:hypothetical protein
MNKGLSVVKREKRANRIIKRLERNDLRAKFKEKNKDIKNVRLKLKWIDQMFDTRAIVYHIWAQYKGINVNVLGEKYIDPLIENFNEITKAHIENLTNDLISTIRSGVIKQYNKFKKLSPEELKETYKEMALADRRDPWGLCGSM